MPYIRVDKCVHKKNPDGSAGETVKCHESVEQAEAHMRALYANVDKGQFVVKEVGGVYYWTGHPSTNARDRAGEIVSAKALRDDVADTSPRDNPAPLRYGHLKVRIGPEPDWRGVVRGVLVEAGHFDDTPLAKGIARYLIAHPEGLDGTGWGMSIGFRGAVDAEGVFHRVRIHERSVLPLSRAANPYTSFTAGGTSMKDLDKAALTELNKILDGGDQDALDALKAQIAAWEQAKALDESDVQRKDAAPDEPAAEEVKAETPVVEAVAETTPEPEVEKKAKPKSKFPPDDEPDDDEDEDEEEPPKRKPKKAAKAKVAEPVAPAPAPVVDEETIKGIAQYVDTRVSALLEKVEHSNEEQTKAINDALESLTEFVATLADQLETLDRRDKGLSAVNETQNRVFEALMKNSASRSVDTAIEKSDPLATKQPAPAPNDMLAIFRK